MSEKGYEKSCRNEYTDIRLITLKRKNVGRHDGSAEENVLQAKGKQSFFATDYFDVMSVEKSSCLMILQKLWVCVRRKKPEMTKFPYKVLSFTAAARGV